MKLPYPAVVIASSIATPAFATCLDPVCCFGNDITAAMAALGLMLTILATLAIAIPSMLVNFFRNILHSLTSHGAASFAGAGLGTDTGMMMPPFPQASPFTASSVPVGASPPLGYTAPITGAPGSTFGTPGGGPITVSDDGAPTFTGPSPSSAPGVSNTTAQAPSGGGDATLGQGVGSSSGSSADATPTAFTGAYRPAAMGPLPWPASQIFRGFGIPPLPAAPAAPVAATPVPGSAAGKPSSTTGTDTDDKKKKKSLPHIVLGWLGIKL